VQIDAHLDFVDERKAVTDGHGNPDAPSPRRELCIRHEPNWASATCPSTRKEKATLGKCARTGIRYLVCCASASRHCNACRFFERFPEVARYSSQLILMRFARLSRRATGRQSMAVPTTMTYWKYFKWSPAKRGDVCVRIDSGRSRPRPMIPLKARRSWPHSFLLELIGFIFHNKKQTSALMEPSPEHPLDF